MLGKRRFPRFSIVLIEIHEDRLNPRAPVTAPEGLAGLLRHRQPVDLTILALGQ